MEVIRKLLKLPPDVYYETHLSIVNSILPVKMTPMETKVLAAFMSLEGDIAQYRFGPSARKVVMKKLIQSPAGLSNYINSLLDKGFLIKRGDAINIIPLLIPEAELQQYQFVLVNLKNNTVNTNNEQVTTVQHTA